MAVAPGKIEAFSEGQKVMSCRTGGGLAVIGGNKVSVLTDKAES